MRTHAVFIAVDDALDLDRAAVRRLMDAGVPVIPVSDMTLEEIAPIAQEVGFDRAMIIEAGGAIARWEGDRWNIEPCGPPAENLLDVVREIEDRSGASLLVYSALSDRDAARLSGRSGEMLSASRRRCFSEPFVLESGDPESVERAAAALGFSVRRGRRLLHLCRACDQATAFARVAGELRCDVTIAVGTAAVDAEFLAHADVAIIVPGPDGKPDAQLLADVPQARIAGEGWASAVDEVVSPLYGIEAAAI